MVTARRRTGESAQRTWCTITYPHPILTVLMSYLCIPYLNLILCATNSSGTELTYNVRYFELNERGRGNPWSLRQTGVYQKCLSSQQSMWIFINFSEYLRGRLGDALQERSKSTSCCCATPVFMPHLFLISGATRNWDLYLEFLRKKLKTFVRSSPSSPLQS